MRGVDVGEILGHGGAANDATRATAIRSFFIGVSLLSVALGSEGPTGWPRGSVE
jgi:hypothetical protein